MKNLVFIVEEVPKSPSQCPFSKWHPNPPILEEPGYYECLLGGSCKIEENKCAHLESINTTSLIYDEKR